MNGLVLADGGWCGGGGGFDTWAHREEKGNGWLVAGRFTTKLKFKTVIKAKKPYRKPDSTLVLKNLTKKIRETERLKSTRVYS